VRRALKQDHNLIICVGGDGTLNEVVNGFFWHNSAINPSASLVVVACGSGGDFRRSLEIGACPLDALAAVTSDKVIDIDLGSIHYHPDPATRAQRFFVNVASIGVPAEVNRLLSKQPSFLGGTGRFLLATVQALLFSKHVPVRLEIDRKERLDQFVKTIAVANGRFFGGGMQVAPQASLDDGLLDIVVIGKVGLLDFLVWGSRFYKGRHLEHPRVNLFRAATIQASSRLSVPLQSVPVEVDGETIGMLPATFEVMPTAIRLRLP